MHESQARFSSAARSHGAGTLEGDSVATNLAYRSIVEALEDLRRAPDQGENALRELLTDEDPSVATWAAVFLLPLDEQSASAVLERIAASGVPLLAFNARMTLREWKAGRLNPTSAKAMKLGSRPQDGALS